MGDGGSHFGARHGDESTADAAAFRIRISGGCGQDGDASDDPRIIACRFDDRARVDLECAGRQKCDNRIRFSNRNNTAAIALGNGGCFANGLGLNSDVPDGGDLHTGVNRGRNVGRRRHSGRDRRDLHTTPTVTAGCGPGFSVRGVRLVISKNLRTRGGCLAVNRTDRDIPSGREPGTICGHGCDRRVERHLGVQGRDCYPAATGAFIGRVRVRP